MIIIREEMARQKAELHNQKMMLHKQIATNSSHVKQDQPPQDTTSTYGYYTERTPNNTHKTPTTTTTTRQYSSIWISDKEHTKTIKQPTGRRGEKRS